jgi:transcriptional regulator of acetoin/glycerol metabolism
MNAMGDTRSHETAERTGPSLRQVAHLFRVISAHAPSQPSSCHALVELDTLEIGRGSAMSHTRSGREMRIDVADAWASEAHARLRRSIGRWHLEDLGSKNSTLINGAKVTTTLLADGDVLEIGRTFFLFATGAERPGETLDVGPAEPLPGVTTIAPALSQALAQLAVVAHGRAPILIRGPTGAGKEVVARGAHQASGRTGPFVPVNCGAIPRELVESTLFGHRRGAFSGASDDEPGVVRSAHGGTLVLDEIGDLPLSAQAALLRVLQEHEVTPVGGTRSISVDLRIVSATHRDLGAMSESGSFRSDLLYRLKGFACALPSLAERRTDLGELIWRLMARLAPDRAERLALHPRVVRTMLAYPWPGNIRELERILGTAIELARDDRIDLEHLPVELRHVPPSGGADVDDVAERELVVSLLKQHRGNIRAIARTVGKDPVQVRRWLRRYGLSADEFR